MSESVNNTCQNNLLRIISTLTHTHSLVLIAISLLLGLATPAIAVAQEQASVCGYNRVDTEVLCAKSMKSTIYP